MSSVTGLSQRLALALDTALDLPDTGTLRVLHASCDTDLSLLPRDRLEIVQPFAPDYAGWCRQGFAARPDLPQTRAAATLVAVPRSKALARGLIAAAAQGTDGPILVDGAKTDGIDSLLRDVRRIAPILGTVSKAHGKLFWADLRDTDMTEWALRVGQVDGFTTAPGVFSADGADPASVRLAEALPDRMGRHVIDLGAGWGFLSAHILQATGLDRLDVVEADATALDCARANLRDPRVRFHWADALAWQPDAKADTVVTNPPFHTGRRADPALGQAFISAARRMLAPQGTLWLVANRHLPYETQMRSDFADVEEVTGTPQFKVLVGRRPRRAHHHPE